MASPAEALASATIVGAYSAASASGPSVAVTATPSSGQKPIGRRSPCSTRGGRSANDCSVSPERDRNAVTYLLSSHQLQAPPAPGPEELAPAPLWIALPLAST